MVAVIAAVAAIAVGILAAFLVRRKRTPREEPPKEPELLLKVGTVTNASIACLELASSTAHKSLTHAQHAGFVACHEH